LPISSDANRFHKRSDAQEKERERLEAAFDFEPKSREQGADSDKTCFYQSALERIQIKPGFLYILSGFIILIINR
jgi:hypothetical protein